MPKLLIFDAFTLLIPEKTVANYALLRCKTFSLKIWVCKIFDKFHVCPCRPQSRQTPIHMYLMWSDMMKVKTTFIITTITTAFHVLVEKISTDTS